MKMTANIFGQHLITTLNNFSCAYAGRTLPYLSGDKVEKIFERNEVHFFTSLEYHQR